MGKYSAVVFTQNRNTKEIMTEECLMDATDLSNCKNSTEEVFVTTELFEDSDNPIKKQNDTLYSSMGTSFRKIQEYNITLLNSFNLDVCTIPI